MSQDIVGRHLIYRFDNGWTYELYIRNASTADYRIHSGMVAGRWVRGQRIDLADLGHGVWKISWHEPTGSSVSLSVMLADRRVHGLAFFPRWVIQHPERTALFQNEHLAEMETYRDQGPIYPVEIFTHHGEITFAEECPPDDDSVIDKGPGDLAPGYADRRN